MSERSYSEDELMSFYELGRMYYEMGYFAPAERIFSGLAAVDQGATPARCGLGLVKLERGLHDQSQQHFRLALQESAFPLQAKLGLVASFLASGEIQRAKSLLVELASELEAAPGENADLRVLWEAFALRCDAG